MLRSVAAKTLRDQRRSLLAWALALAGLVGMYAAVYPSVKGNSSYSNVIDQMPKALRALFTAGGGDLTTPAGYLNTELMTLMGPILVLVYAIGAGAAAVAGEEDRGTLDLLLANPVTRARVVVEKFAALVAGVSVLSAAMWLAVVAEGRAVGLDLPVGSSAAAMVHLGLLGVEFGALALLVGAATGHLTAARAVPGGLAVVAFLVNGLAGYVTWLGPVRPASPFYQYIGHDPLRTGLWGAAAAVSVASAAVLVAVAVAAFGRRDVLA